MSATEVSKTASVPLAVWPVSQTSSQYQRTGRYVPESTEHPGKMVPALARRIIEEYSKEGDLVVDPMAGIGTSIVEGASVGRRTIGIDLEQRWVEIATQNMARVVPRTLRKNARAVAGDVLRLSEVLGAQHGGVDLIVTSPPYGCDIATVDKSPSDGTITKGQRSRNYSKDIANLGHARGAEYENQMREVYRACFDALRPGGFLVTVTKNMRRKGRLVDLAGVTVQLAESVGFGYLQHNIALLCGVRDGALVARPSFWQMKQTQNARSRGIPQSVVVHEDVCVFVKDGAVNV